MGAASRVAGAVLILSAGCHLALGLEPASELETTTTSSSSNTTPECTQDVQCDDDNPCTVARCVAGQCDNEALDSMAAAELQMPEDCKVAVCRQGVLQQDNDDGDPFDDGIPCTDDRCENGEPSNPPAAGGTTCETGVCNGESACTECFSDMECTAPDRCGAGATPFTCGCTPDTCNVLGLTCGNAPNGCVGALNCYTLTQNGGETDVDCGGPAATCPQRCAGSQKCSINSDCASNDCTMAGFCNGN